MPPPTFDSDAAATTAALDACADGSVELDGRPIRVKLDGRPNRAGGKKEERVEASSGTALYVNNLPWSTTSEDLAQIYADYNCTSAEIQLRRDGKSMGYGIVKFDTADQAAAAIDGTHGTELGGRQIFARLDKFS